MDENNFRFDLNGWHIHMFEGVLKINNYEYQEDEDDPTYSLVREIASLRGSFK